MRRKRSDPGRPVNIRCVTGAAVMQPRVTNALTRALVIEWARHGYAALSLEAVARRAGVGKAALYRRWPSKLAMVSERIETVGLDLAMSADTGTLPGDIREVLFTLRRQLRHPFVRRILADLHAEMTRNSQLAQNVRQRLQVGRRNRGTMILQRAIDRGEIPLGMPLELVKDTFAALLYWRLVVLDEVADDSYLEALAQTILHTLGWQIH